MNHAIFNRPLEAEIPDNMQRILFGMGCFWGAEKCFWQLEGVYLTAVGYAGGSDDEPTYEKVCTGSTGHAEVVEVFYDPENISTSDLLKVFWENHNPTQGMQQGNDKGTQYRSMIICFDREQIQQAIQSRMHYQEQLKNNNYGDITTEIIPNQHFYLAEEYHQQYLHKNPSGYCGLGGTGTCM